MLVNKEEEKYKMTITADLATAKNKVATEALKGNFGSAIQGLNEVERATVLSMTVEERVELLANSSFEEDRDEYIELCRKLGANHTTWDLNHMIVMSMSPMYQQK